MWFQPDPNQPHWGQLTGINLRRLFLWAVVLGILVLAARIAHPRFNRWREAKYVEQARDSLRKNDIRSAALFARNAIALNTDNLAASKLLAEMADRMNSPAALVWRKHVAELEPERTENYLVWAGTALKQNQTFIADLALSSVPAVDRQTLGFITSAGSLALAEKDYRRAESYFAEAVNQAPTNRLIQLNLASIRLLSNSTNTVQQARQTLEQLRQLPDLRVAVTRILVNDSERLPDPERNLKLARELVELPGAVLNDRLQLLAALKRAKKPDFERELITQQTAITSSGDIYAIASWMNAHGLASEAEDWIRALPLMKQINQPVPIALAELLITQRRWNALNDFTANSNWQELNFMRLAYNARALRESDDDANARRHWRQIMILCERDPQRLAMLARLLEGWQWSTELEEVYWRLVQLGKNRRQALQSLFRMFADKGETRQMLRVSQRAVQINPRDLIAKNNLASLSMLLKESASAAYKMAEENHRVQPANPAFAVTHAFALVLQKREKEAKAIFENISPDILEVPAVAAYYGLVLAALGDPRAASYLDIAVKSAKLLPEELTLIEKARTGLR
jgi:hypothetical protein